MRIFIGHYGCTANGAGYQCMQEDDSFEITREEALVWINGLKPGSYDHLNDEDLREALQKEVRTQITNAEINEARKLDRHKDHFCFTGAGDFKEWLLDAAWMDHYPVLDETTEKNPKDLLDEILIILDAHPDWYEIVFEHYFEKKTLRKIAEEKGCKEKQIQKKHTRALRSIEKYYRARGISYSSWHGSEED